MSEILLPAQPAEEFRGIVNNGDFNADYISRLEHLAGQIDVVDDIANSYWRLKLRADKAPKAELDEIINHPDMRAGRLLIGALSHEVEEPVKEQMWTKYGFEVDDLEGFNSEEIVRIYLELVGLVASTHLSWDVGQEFRRGLPEFGNNSRLDYLRQGRFGKVRRKVGAR